LVHRLLLLLALLAVALLEQGLVWVQLARLARVELQFVVRVHVLPLAGVL
jgi:hypothetical protein